MFKRPQILISLLLLAACNSATKIPTDDREAILTDLARLHQERERGKADLLLALTHETNFALAGGEQAYRNSIADSYSNLDNIGFKVTRFSLGKMYPIYQSEEKRLIVVPRESQFEVGGCRWFSSTYIVAIQEAPSTHWQYFFATKLQQRETSLADIFPFLPNNIDLPPNYAEPLNRHSAPMTIVLNPDAADCRDTDCCG